MPSDSDTARRVRVLVVAPSIDILGGQALQAQRLMQGLAASTEVHAEFLAVNPRLPGFLAYLQRVKYLRTVVTSIAYFAALLRAVPRCDVVHAFSASYFSYLLAPLPALIAARVFRRRSILNYRSGEAADHLARWRLSRWTMARLPSLVVVPSGYLIDVFARFGIRAHSIVNFVPIERLPFRARAQLSPRLLSNRNLEAHYNVACILRAFKGVQQQFVDARLDVVGDGPQRVELEALAARLSLRNVTFVGRVPNARMLEYYQRNDIYVNSPDIDNMPSSILEAFACGLPVVTTNAGGIPYIVDEARTGLLVDRDDSAAMARAVLRLLDDPAFAGRLAHAARAECETRYVWPRVQAQWEACYMRLLSRNSP